MLKFLFLLILLYYAFRAVRGLLRAVLTDQRGAPPQMPRSRPDAYTRPSERATAPSWRGPAAGRSTREEDIEDAKWQDL